MSTYMIRRFFMNGDKEFVKGGLTLEEAREHCADPETSYKTCTDPKLIELTEKRGPWFDGYDEE